MSIFEKIRKHSLRLSVDGKPIGSCVAINIAGNNYILTAKHCIKLIQDYISIGVFLGSGKFNEFVQKKHEIEILFIDDEVDLVAFSIKVEEFKSELKIPKIEIAYLEDELLNSQIHLCGFPFATNHEEPVVIPLTYNNIDEFGFAATPNNIKLDDDNSDALSNVEALSGSGVFLIKNQKMYLVGIVSKFVTRIERFKIVTLQELKKVIPGIKVLTSAEIPLQSNNVELLRELRRQLVEAENYVHRLKPHTALEEVESLRKEIIISNLSAKDKSKLIAECDFIEGCSLALTETTSNNVNKLFLKAYIEVPTEVKYKERVVYFYIRAEESEKAESIVDSLILSDPYNIRAWALKISFFDKEAAIPNIVLENPRFIYNRFIYSTQSNTILSVDDLAPYFEHVADDRTINSKDIELDHNNFHFYLFYAIYLLSRNTKKVRQLNDVSLSDKEQVDVDRAKQILDSVLAKFEVTELKQTITFTQANFYHEYAKYRVTPSTTGARKLAVLFRDKDIITKELKKGFDVIIALFTQQLYQEVIELIDELQPQEALFCIIKGDCYKFLNQTPKAILSYEEYLKRADNIDLVELRNLFLIVNELQILKFDNSILQSEVLRKSYEVSYASDLLESYILRSDKNQKDFCRGKVSNIRRNYWSELICNFKDAIGVVFFEIGDIDDAIDIFAEIVDKSRDSSFQKYIESLWRGKKFDKELVSLLEEYRTLHPVFYNFLVYEIQLANTVDNYSKVEVLCNIGLKSLPLENIFKVELINILHKQKNTVEIKKYLQDALLEIDIPIDDVFHLSQICFLHGKKLLSIQLAYQALKRFPDNVDVKMAYWAAMLRIERSKILKSPEKVSFGNFVLIKIDERIEVIEVKEQGESNPVIQALLGAKVDDVVKYSTKFDRIEATVIKIVNKYEGELKYILDEAENPAVSGLPIKSFSGLGEEGQLSIDKMTSQFQETFGKEGLANKLEIEQEFEKYTNCEIGFTLLANRVFRGNYLECYYSITSVSNWGFNIFPIIKQHSTTLNAVTEYVLDFTSLLLFFELSDEFKFEFKNFYISQSTKDIIVREIYELEQSEKDKASLIILPDRVIPHSYPEDYVGKKLEKYQALFKWVEENCKVAYIDYTLNGDTITPDLISQHTKKKYLTHTLLISLKTDRVLISDDSFFHENGLPIQVISSEVFIKCQSRNIYERALQRMMCLNYNGLNISADTLLWAFEKSKIRSRYRTNIFKTALKSFVGKYNPNTENLLVGMHFIKYIFCVPIDKYVRIEVVKLIFYSIFKEPYFDFSSDTYREFHRLVSAEFALLGDADKVILKCFREVIRDLHDVKFNPL